LQRDVGAADAAHRWSARPTMQRRPHPDAPPPSEPVPWLGRMIGRSRVIVLFAVIAVLLAAFSLFLIGTVQAVTSVWGAWSRVFDERLGFTGLTVQFLEIVSTMLKAVVFYLIGVGLYSLFIAPLNVAVSLGVETLHDLESKVINVVIVILAVTFLEHFILWKAPLETLQFGAALALTVSALVLFQLYSHRAKAAQKASEPDVQARAKHEMFELDREKHHVEADGTKGPARGARR
jgi:uncharacterized membrane protein YqhA